MQNKPHVKHLSPVSSIVNAYSSFHQSFLHYIVYFEVSVNFQLALLKTTQEVVIYW